MLIFIILALAVLADGYSDEDRALPPGGDNWFERRCQQNGANYSQVEVTAVNSVKCMETEFDVKTFQNEFKNAELDGSYDKVLAKYCAKSPQLKNCYHKLVDAATPCLGAGQEYIAISSVRLADQLLDYICSENGNTIAKLKTEGGYECLVTNKIPILKCVDDYRQSLASKIENINVSGTQDLQRTLQCIARALESCNSTALSKIVGDVSKLYIKNDNEMQRNATTDTKGDSRNESTFKKRLPNETESKEGTRDGTVEPRTSSNETESKEVTREGEGTVEPRTSSNETESKEVTREDTVEPRTSSNETESKEVTREGEGPVEPRTSSNETESKEVIRESTVDPRTSSNNTESKEVTREGQGTVEPRTSSNETESKEVTREGTVEPRTSSNETESKEVTREGEGTVEPRTSSNETESKEVTREGTVEPRLSSNDTEYKEVTRDAKLKIVKPYTSSFTPTERVYYNRSRAKDSELHPGLKKLVEINKSMTLNKYDIMQRYCEQNGGNMDDVKHGVSKFTNCMEGIVDVNEIQWEFAKARDNGLYDTFLKKYCSEMPQLKSCYHDFIKVVSPCLNNQSSNFTTIAMKFNDGLLDYLCKNDGYQLSKFFKMGGIECLESKNHEINECTDSANLTESGVSPMLDFFNFGNYLRCVGQKVNSCKSKVPSESLTSLAEELDKILSENLKEVPGRKLMSATTTSTKIPRDGRHYKASGKFVLSFDGEFILT